MTTTKSDAWRVIAGADLCELITKGASPGWQGFEYQESGAAFITSENVRDGYLSTETPKFLPVEFHCKLQNSQLKAGDILLNIVGASIGRACKYDGRFELANINQAVCLMRVKAEFDPDYVLYYLQFPDSQRRLLDMQSDSARPNLSLGDIRSMVFEVPSLVVQRRIAEVLRSWDEAIEKTNQLIGAKSAAFDHWALMLLSGRKRLGSKRSNWQSVALTDVTNEATTRNGSCPGEEVVMGVNKSLGMIPMKEHVRAADLSRYKIVTPEAFAYNPMRLNIGSIAQNLHGREVLVSPDYVAFSVQPDALLPAYFEHVRRSLLWSRFVKTAGSGGVRVRIYYDDLADFVFELPPVPEQRRIVDVLNTGRREIALLEAQRDALAKQKRGLMQKLLTGEWPVSAPKTKEAAE